MKKLYKSLFVMFLGTILGYYICFSGKLINLFKSNYKAFQVGVYTSLDAAKTYSSKYKNSIVVSDDELYRVYVAILKDDNNINTMSKYLNDEGIEFYLRDIDIVDSNIKKEIREYENIMDNNNEVVFLEVNKKIMEMYEESL